LTFIDYYYIFSVTPWQNVLVKDTEQPRTLLEEYHIRKKSEGTAPIGLTENSHFPEEKEVFYDPLFFR